MSFWSILGDIGSAVAAPFTGGASLAAIPAINAISNSGSHSATGQNGVTDLSQILGGYANNAAAGRLAQATAQQNQAKTANELYSTQLAAALNGPKTLAQNAAQGDILSNVQPVSISGLPSYIHMPQISGGLSPALLGPGSRQAGAALTRNALMNLMSNNGNPFPLPKAPTLDPLPQASGLDKAAGYGALGTGVLGALSPWLSSLGSNTGGATDATGGFVGPVQPFGDYTNSNGVYDPETDPWATIDPGMFGG